MLNAGFTGPARAQNLAQQPFRSPSQTDVAFDAVLRVCPRGSLRARALSLGSHAALSHWGHYSGVLVTLRLINGSATMAGKPNHAEMDPGAGRAEGVTTYVLAIHLVGAEIARHPSYATRKRKRRSEMNV
jgi:hypothetical protein